MWRQYLFVFTLILICNIKNTRAQDYTEDYTLEGNLSGGNRHSRIVGGVPAKPHSYPSIVLMTYGKYIACGGSILNDEWVLSAAHCVDDPNPKIYGFLAGRHDKSKQEGTEQKVSVVKVIVHEGFSDDMKNDIALFKVSPKFKFNDKVKAVVLAPKTWNIQKGKALAIGWGKTSQSSNRGSNILQQVWLPVVNNGECKKLMGLVSDTNLCAGSVKGGKDACQGDSGGPLYFRDKSNLVQVGVVSWGDGCAQRGKVGVFTRVSKYIDWIRSKTGAKLG